MSYLAPSPLAPFYRAVLDRPDDDTPRLIMADLLDEHDFGEWAEFIRRQVAEAGKPPSQGTLDLMVGRACVWWEWLSPDTDLEVSAIVENYQVRRGFPERWTGPADQWMADYQWVLAEAPIREVHWTRPVSPVFVVDGDTTMARLMWNVLAGDEPQQFAQLWPGIAFSHRRAPRLPRRSADGIEPGWGSHPEHFQSVQAINMAAAQDWGRRFETLARAPGQPASNSGQATAPSGPRQ